MWYIISFGVYLISVKCALTKFYDYSEKFDVNNDIFYTTFVYISNSNSYLKPIGKSSIILIVSSLFSKISFSILNFI